jgi:hypothetical protein
MISKFPRVPSSWACVFPIDFPLLAIHAVAYLSCLLSGFSYHCFQMIQASNFVHMNVITYTAPKLKKNQTASQISRQHPLKEHTILKRREGEHNGTEWRDRGTAFSVMPSVCLETEPTETSPLFFMHSAYTNKT